MALFDCSECGREISDKAPACPHCGAPVEDVLIDSKKEPHSKVFFDERGVAVTTTRFTLPGSKTFAMSGVTAVRMTMSTPSKVMPTLFTFAGVALGWAIVQRDAQLPVQALIFPAAIVAAGLLWLKSLKPTYYVVLSSASGETQALRDQSRQWIKRVVDALNDCIIHRG